MDPSAELAEEPAPRSADAPAKEPSHGRARTALFRWSFAIVPLVGVVELIAHLGFAKRPPSFDAWADVRAAVETEKRPGELVVIAPRWADPAARRAFGDALMPMRDEGRPDESRYASALEVSILGASAPDLEGWKQEGERTLGKFVLRHRTNPSPAHVVFDFVDNARPPLADVRGTSPPITCTWNPRAAVETVGFGGHPTFPRERFECPTGAYFFVGETVIADQDFRARRCLWSHPFAHGEIVTRFRGVPLGSVIRGHGGIHWMTERDLRGAPITLTVRVGGDAIGTYTHADGDGWKPFEFALGRHAGEKDAEVEFAVTTTNYRDRHFCFEADTR
jgi:hypothetical protein